MYHTSPIYIPDLALVVDSQDDDIQRLNRKSVEALDHAQSGLGHVTATTHRQDDQIWVHKAIAFAAAAMVLCYIVVGLFHSST